MNCGAVSRSRTRPPPIVGRSRSTGISSPANASAGNSGLVKWLALGRGLFNVLGSIVVVATTATIGVTLMAGVVVRYVLDSSLAWGNELPVILFPWLIMGGVVMASLIHQSGSILMYMQYQTTPVLGWPASRAFYSMPVGAAGVLMLAIIDLVGLLSGRETPLQDMPS